MPVVLSNKEIQDIVLQELNKAENIWKQVEPRLYSDGGSINEDLENAIHTQIPSHPIVRPGIPQVADFIAMILDIRDSSKHLTQRISSRITNVTNLERVLYETTAVFAACSLIVERHRGGVTEYLGDGFLSLFHLPEAPETKRKEEIRNAYRAAERCLNAVNTIVNPILKNTYGLPPLKVGIGLGSGQAVITTAGIGDNLQAKALGECVFYASKLSSGDNKIVASEGLKRIWPVGKNGKVKFKPYTNPKNPDFSGFIVYKSE